MRDNFELFQKAKNTELERQISDEAHWIRCENQKTHCSIAAVNRSDWRVEKWHKVNAVPWVGLRPPCVPALTYSTTLSK